MHVRRRRGMVAPITVSASSVRSITVTASAVTIVAASSRCRAVTPPTNFLGGRRIGVGFAHPTRHLVVLLLLLRYAQAEPLFNPCPLLSLGGGFLLSESLFSGGVRRRPLSSTPQPTEPRAVGSHCTSPLEGGGRESPQEQQQDRTHCPQKRCVCCWRTMRNERKARAKCRRNSGVKRKYGGCCPPRTVNVGKSEKKSGLLLCATSKRRLWG